MEKKIKAAQLKKRQSHALIQNLEQFKDSYTARDSGDIPVCLEQLECHKADFMDAISKLEELDDRPEAIDGYIQERCDMDSRFRRLKGFFLQQQPTEANPLNASLLYANASALSTSHTGSINLRLPKIELPTFDGDSTKWLTFRDRFVAMIDSSVDIPSIMKLQYLLSSLKGDAGLLFEHTTLTADNYAVTWNSLLKRYDNPRMLTREYYRKIHYLPAVQSENVDELAQLVDEFTRHVNGLRKLNEPIETWDTPLTNMLFLKLDSSTILAWEKFSAHHEKDKYKQLIDFLQDRVRILRSTRTYAQETELHSRKVECIQQSRKMTGSEQKMRLKAGVNAATARRPQPNPATVPSSSCPLGCAEMHNLRTCPEFAKKELHQRRQIIVSERLCWNCLNRGHQVKSCSSSHRCNTCNARHHSMLHDHLHPKAILSVHADVDAVCLETVVLNLVDDHGFRYEARALLDSGSMCNLISDSLARRMLSTQSKVNVTVSGIGQASQQIKGCIVATVESKSQQFSSQLEFLVLKNPVMDIPTEPIDVTAWKFPTDNLADEAFNIPAKIDVVIGSEAYWEMHTGRKLSLGKGKPWLVETPFGWAVAGNTSLVSTSIQRSCHTTTIQATLDGMLQRFWETESIMEGPAMSVEENMCEKHYVATTHRNAQGRYVVSLPQNLSSSRVLGLSRAIADRRLLGVERRLKSNPEMDIEYKRFMREYEELGHMRKLTEPVDDSITHCYIPHHAVLKESSTSTKVRVVFDASCKTTSGYSLNDTLLVGPIVQEDLLSIILRFRSHAIAIVADVEKMYRQILHSDQDRNLLRIRYRESQVDPIATYELTTVTYGTASAPFLATRTLQQIAHDHKDKFPKAVNPVLHDFYVDDLLTGATDINEAIAVRNQISAMLNSAGFTLKKWASNVPESLRDVPQEDLAIQSLHEWKDGQAVSTLGAIHIELVSDLTTTAFLAALRRFVARRGKVCELHSDNATTFKGAANELRRLYEMLKTNDEDRRSIVDWCANNEMDWKFIPPRAPHFGGLWEAAVKSAKRHMMKIIGTTSITQENMLTLLAQVEQCLNSRPLIPLSDEPSDTEALTPGHFLVGSNMQAVPEVDMRHIPSNRLKEYQLVQKQVQQIWSRWYPEYLQQLQARAKHYNNAPVELEINQLAIIKEDNLHPTVWPLGRITALHPGKDGVTR
ncbi:uncharacterized protein LOC128309295, partial [Anopheles moucheti]|uniref:uncharacterized protein LOC128309295 n=1 Tax=Anopheles moucheti TaxID=186751 RepID=UPI0022F04E80